MAFRAISSSAAEPVIDAAAQIDHRREYHVRELGTRSVTLFPTRAHVVRDIKDVPLKVGTNQIAIIGLTPTLDENSVKIDGTGHALITNLVVELLPNREIFDDVFTEPDDVNDPSDDSGTDSLEQDDDDPELEAVLDKIRLLEDENKVASEAVRSAESRLHILEAYGHSMAAGNEGHSKTPFEDGMRIYQNERAEIFRTYREGESKAQDILKKMRTLKKEEGRLRKRIEKRRVKARVARNKEIEKQRRKDLEQAKERARIRAERELYWPKKVYVITLNVDVKPTPDDDEGFIPDDVDMKTCDMTLSYATDHAFWSPTYDMSLSTTSNSGLLYFDARLINQTSETWDKCNIALSTSQTELSDINEPAPKLLPWTISLNRKFPSETPGIMYSHDETGSWAHPIQEQKIRFQRHELFGVDRLPLHHDLLPKPRSILEQESASNIAPARTGGLFGPPQGSWWKAATARTGGLFGPPQPAFGATAQASGFGQPSPPGGGGLFGSQPTAGNGGLFGNSQSAGNNGLSGNSQPAANSGLFGDPSQAQVSQRSYEGAQPVADFPEKDVSDADNCPTPVSFRPDLEFEESNFEETGLTTTYALVGLKSLSPSSTTSRHRVARMAYSDVVFSYVAVPKIKRVVFLKAKVRHASKLTLPKGRTGLTLDGSFLGRVALPRCSTGDTFSLNLGNDPSIRVLYPKPEAKHRASSLFSGSQQDNHSLFTRTITLVNTRDKLQEKPLQITVLDQVPVSQDERLRITIFKPEGLVVDGPTVCGGDDTDCDKSWGKAEAKLKRGGEVEWAVTVNPGCSAKLSLSYACDFPIGTQATNA